MVFLTEKQLSTLNGNQRLAKFLRFHGTQNSNALIKRIHIFWSISDKHFYVFLILRWMLRLEFVMSLFKTLQFMPIKFGRSLGQKSNLYWSVEKSVKRVSEII